MTQVCHTAGLWDYLPSFLQRAASPIVELLVDDMRGALYARTANSEVQPSLLAFAHTYTATIAMGTAVDVPAGDADSRHLCCANSQSSSLTAVLLRMAISVVPSYCIET
jgi:hypothetical protein